MRTKILKSERLADFYETSRLLLRPLSLTDHPALFEMDNDADVMHFTGQPVISSKAKSYEELLQRMADGERLGLERWTVVLKETNEMTGWCGLRLNEFTLNGYTDFIDLGYRLRKKFWGKGYASEAVKQWVDIADNVLELPEIIGIVHEQHDSSQRILKKNGFALQNTFLEPDGVCWWMVRERFG